MLCLSDWQKGKVKLGQLDLEGALIARDQVGIQDFVLLDAHNSETAFLDNLKKRFTEDLIYVSEKQRLISIFIHFDCIFYKSKDISILTDLHRYSADICKPIQRVGHLCQETNGPLHGSELL